MTRGLGEGRLVFGEVTGVIRVSAQDSGGAVTVVEEVPPMVDTPLHVHMGNVLAAVRVAGGELTLRRLFTPPHTRSRLIGLFQAILELVKSGDLVPVQPHPFGDIRLRLGDAQRASS